MRGIGKLFPGVRALDNVDFTLHAGEIHALLGENGAGKSTLIKVLTGVYPRDAGEIRLVGEPIAPRAPQHAQTLGISTVYQEVNLIPYLSVAENIFLGRQPRRFGRIR
jgi:simple sugar transport system ATP-binding protein